MLYRRPKLHIDRHPAIPPGKKRRFCWYRRELRHLCGQATLRESGLCPKHDVELEREAQRLDVLVSRNTA